MKTIENLFFSKYFSSEIMAGHQHQTVELGATGQSCGMKSGSKIIRFAFQIHFPDESIHCLVYSKQSNVFFPPTTRDNII